jgi:hypothetical protein
LADQRGHGEREHGLVHRPVFAALGPGSVALALTEYAEPVSADWRHQMSGLKVG